MAKGILRYWQTRTYCCGHIVADTNVSPFARARNICCGHKFCVRNIFFPVCAAWKHNIPFVSRAFAQPKKLHEQQCVLVCQYLNVCQPSMSNPGLTTHYRACRSFQNPVKGTITRAHSTPFTFKFVEDSISQLFSPQAIAASFAMERKRLTRLL